MKKKLFAGLLITLSLVLVGCGSGNTEEVSTVALVLPAETYKIYDADNFTLQYPRDWETKNKSQVASQYKDSVQAVFISNFKDQFFTPVITVELVAVEEGVGNPGFADEMIARNEAVLIDYEELERLTIPTVIGSDVVNTYLVRFQGKEKLQDDTLEFLQTYLAFGSAGFVATAAYDPTSDLNEAEKLVNSLQTFKLK
jgi:hypothetical protein